MLKMFKIIQNTNYHVILLVLLIVVMRRLDIVAKNRPWVLKTALSQLFINVVRFKNVVVNVVKYFKVLNNIVIIVQIV
jgi:hypothetical protein